MNPTQIIKVARREYLARVRNRAFVFMTILIPVLMGLYAFVMPLIVESGSGEVRLASVDTGSAVGPALEERLRELEQPRITVTDVVTVANIADAPREELNAEVHDDAIDGYLLVERDDDELLDTRYVSTETTNVNLVRVLRNAVRSVAVTDLLAGSGINPDDLRRRQQLDVATVTLSAEGEREGGSETAFMSTLVLAMLIYMTILINGQGMATAIVEENSSRLIEVILGAVTAGEFMAGKILGVLGAGLTQLGIWLVVALAALLQALPGIMIGSEAAGLDLGSILTGELLFYFALFFALGYFLYSVLIAVIAVTCTSTEELRHSMIIAALPLIVAVMLAVTAIVNPSSELTRISSLIPPFTPIVMLARINVSAPPLWEVWLSVVLLIVTTVAASWVAGNIFRYALLMIGKRPTLPELLPVVRTA